ncbi:MBL fold metallo-hydrolase [Marinomonas mediterranea]|jgi:Zn-dependent hydrolases, including glyoxylases|uniref:Beta-lactamase domain protein n=1 Tax=Marinomonas mediterranea (strain ATCC 700492 / JCM 21426 / NBRC 103028 / MMB-1) TaxID=717774 RepID=F2JZ11_MARM1|nr:MBL fold metallo-hydrolase [Marinomonas mediterranea]ADZ91989.1 beta-lactamase domain protein [Marinomonas mediterranea MMB-1]WCN09933.1 MBL fold metallo-hydrolase [Marinomonas mediterranea]WCN14015.1 MBL fold metallo-hydrolase [Marinomonas mediterranea]WCN18066.1 MBL fold metallo-hydrolase [Marinomonas mediterranea MMB-1]
MPLSDQPLVTAFFDEATFTVSYAVTDPKSLECAIIDSVLDYDAASGRTSSDSADQIIEHIKQYDLTLKWILETHVHADHLSAAPYLKSKLGGDIVIGDHITTIQTTFGSLFNAEPEFLRDGSQFDVLVSDAQSLPLGDLSIEVMHTPGHTPACVTYNIGDAAFVGDTLFMPDYGTARCDFPGGDASTLYRSIQRIFALPDSTRLFMCHDYKAPGRDEYQWETTVAEQKRSNAHIHSGVSEGEFCEMRTTKDKTLSMPKLILPSVQVNMRAGELPPAEDNGIRYLKIPLNAV